MERKNETDFLYSVGMAGFALLNSDGSVPSPQDWKDVDNQGVERKHQGGIIGRGGTFDISKVASSDCYIDIMFGTKKTKTLFSSGASDKRKANVREMVRDLNTCFNNVRSEGITLKAEVFTVEGEERIRIYDDSSKLPYYAPIGLKGIIPSILGIQGFILTEDVKSVKMDFEKEAGKSVDITSGRGIRCVVKEADKIKGLNLTISMAGQNSKILSVITGHRYNEKSDEFFVDGASKPPAFAFIYFVKAFSKGENSEASFEKVKAVCFPSCQATLPGDSAQEGAFSTVELQASASTNKKSNLPLMFYKGISTIDYTNYVEKEEM